jgi:predicted MFS family arabinose efflux permease
LTGSDATAGFAEPPGVVPPSPLQISLALTVGSTALLMLGLQPLLLGALVEQGRLTVDQLGLAATAELLALGLTSGLLASLLKPARVRIINALACAALAAANILSVVTSGYGFVASRALAGMAAGFLVWIAIVMITRSRAPDRVAGIFLTVQTLAQAALAALLPVTAMVRWGANGGLAALAGLAVMSMLASLVLQDRFSPLPKPAETKAGLPLRGIAGLASVFLYMAGIVGLWVFVERLGASAGTSTQVAGIAVAAALAAQVTGSSSATFLSGKWPTMPVLAACALGNIAVVTLLGAPIGQSLYLIGVVIFGFLWLFAMPFQTKLLIELDQTRRSAMLLSAAQLLGCAAGPLITSAFATDASLRGALAADAALFGAALLLTLCLRPAKTILRAAPSE